MAPPTTSPTPLLCAISGQTPTDPVVTPSGHICSRSLLLTKLLDTNGIDPFDPTHSRPLDESSLISLSPPSEESIIPPRPLEATSVPSLLSLLQKEYDAVLLELFDTRRALEETRRELSAALYQNDAAVRVVARLASERDEAREQLASFTPSSKEEGGQKRRRVEESQEKEEEEVGPKAPPVLVEPDSTTTTTTETPSNKIPEADLTEMKSKWKTLSKSRRKRPPPPSTHATKDDLLKFTSMDKKALHKSSAKAGITALVVDHNNQEEEDVALTAGKDKHLVLYSKMENKIVKSLNVGNVVTCADMVKKEDGEGVFIVTGDADGRIQVFTGKECALVGSATLEGGGEVVGVSIHPTASFVVAATREGMVAFLSISSGSVVTKAVFREEKKKKEEEEEEGVKYTCSKLHPDGLIFGVGTEEGELKIWDLQTQSLAQTLQGHKGKVTSLSFSENGYHVASSSTSGEVLVWDLRKGKTIKTLNDDGKIGPVHSVAFDYSGKYLAYGGEGGIVITVVKEWDVSVLLGGEEEEGSCGVTGVAWGKDAKSLVSVSEKERAMRYWGPPAAVVAAKSEQDDDAVKMEEG